MATFARLSWAHQVVEERGDYLVHVLRVPDVLGQVLVDRLADDPVEALQPGQPDLDHEVGVAVLDVAHGGEPLDEEVVAPADRSRDCILTAKSLPEVKFEFLTAVDS